MSYAIRRQYYTNGQAWLDHLNGPNNTGKESASKADFKAQMRQITSDEALIDQRFDFVDINDNGLLDLAEAITIAAFNDNNDVEGANTDYGQHNRAESLAFWDKVDRSVGSYGVDEARARLSQTQDYLQTNLWFVPNLDLNSVYDMVVESFIRAGNPRFARPISDIGSGGKELPSNP